MKGLFLILFLTTLNCYSQITVKNGNSLTISNGTTIKIKSINDTLHIENNATVINHGIIDLDTAGYILEYGTPITGNGFETISNPNLTPLNYLNFGGLGFEFKSSINITNASIKRLHDSTLTPYESIKRKYICSSDNQSVIDSKINYHNTELNNHNKSKLFIAFSEDNLAPFVYFKDLNDTTSNFLTEDNSLFNGLYTIVDGTPFLNIPQNKLSQTNIYPNPTNNNSSFSISASTPFDYYIYSPNGKLITFNLHVLEERININDYAKGIYFIKINSNYSTEVKKIIIN